jgi:hypothetical protein
MRATTLLLVGALLIPQAAFAVITFNQLDDDIFTISHRIKVIGSRAKAMKLVYEKAASVCIAAGYTHFKILDQESGAGQQGESGNASIRTQFFLEDAEGRIECEKNASEEYVQQARKKLTKRGYTPPEPAPAVPAGEAAGGASEGPAATKTCTVEQVTAMVRAGFTDEQIKAACPAGTAG